MKKEFLTAFLITIMGFLSTIGSIYAQTDNQLQNDPFTHGPITKKEKKQTKKSEEKEYLKGRRWRISASYIVATMNSSIAFSDLEGKLEASISLENLLGYEKTKIIPKFDFQYSFNRHSSLYAEYYHILRSAEHMVDEDLEWEGIIIPEGSMATSFLDTRIWSLGYMYSFINKPHAEVSFFANVFLLSVYTGIDVERSNIHSRFRITAPLPSFGYRFGYEILPKVRFGATHSFFFLTIGDYGGNISNFKVSLDYRTFKWMSIGASYTDFQLKVKSDARDFRGIIEYAYEGPGLYLQFKF